MATSHEVASNDEASPTSPPLTLPGLDSGTSLLASADGATHSDSPASPTMPTSGPGPVRANRSARPVANSARATLDIFGQHGSHSSSSVALLSCVESRLRAMLASAGSTACSLIWKDRVTPSGRRILARRGLALRTSDSGSISWHTPTARDYKGCTGRDGESICNQLRALYGGSGKPNPRWIAWLMGYAAEEWESCAVTATPSSRKSPRRSSKPRSERLKISGHQPGEVTMRKG